MSKPRKTISLATIGACLVGAATTLSGAPAWADGHASDLYGSWASIACEVRPQPQADGSMGEWWLTRALTLSTGRIDAEFTTYAGPGCGFPVQVLSFGGRVEIIGDSDVIEGAFEADLTIDDYVRITPMAQPFADSLNGSADGDCGEAEWVVGQTQDILATGCSYLGVEADTPTIEYEILAVVGEHIYFGARPVDGSFITTPEKRPSALLVPAQRVQ